MDTLHKDVWAFLSISEEKLANYLSLHTIFETKVVEKNATHIS
jgi:hypothetical protein